jgi:hypothetical protein
MTAEPWGLAAVGSILVAASLYVAGHMMTNGLRITPTAGGDWIPCDGARHSGPEGLSLPDNSVLGEVWGKEVRRLVGELDRPRLRVAARTGAAGAFPHPGAPPARIIACGREAERGLALRARFPKADLILVYPLGRPDIPEDFGGEVTVILPMLDTAGYARRWRAVCRNRGWTARTSPGVGQDIRLVWPLVLTGET